MINRRDFLSGCALSVAAGSAISPLEALAQGALSPYGEARRGNPFEFVVTSKDCVAALAMTARAGARAVS